VMLGGGVNGGGGWGRGVGGGAGVGGGGGGQTKNCRPTGVNAVSLMHQCDHVNFRTLFYRIGGQRTKKSGGRRRARIETALCGNQKLAAQLDTAPDRVTDTDLTLPVGGQHAPQWARSNALLSPAMLGAQR